MTTGYGDSVAPGAFLRRTACRRRYFALGMRDFILWLALARHVHFRASRMREMACITVVTFPSVGKMYAWCGRCLKSNVFCLWQSRSGIVFELTSIAIRAGAIRGPRTAFAHIGFGLASVAAVRFFWQIVWSSAVATIT